MATSYLNLTLKALSYNDQPATANPMRRHFDWSHVLSGLVVSNPKGTPYTVLPNSSLAIFSGVRSTSLDGTTQFTLSVSPLSTNRYRFTTSGGTLPVLRTDRALTANGHTFTWVANANATATLTSSTGGEFAAVQVSDSLWIPGTTTGDTAGPFSPLNEGLWIVLSKDGTNTILQLARPTGVDFSGTSEAIVVTSNSQAQAFSATGVQINDTVDISAGFALPVQQSYVISAVTPTWFEVITSATLPVAQVAIPGISGIVFYSTAKRLLIIESDQEAAVQVNGDTTQNNRVSPLAAGDPDQTGFYWKFGTTWSLTVVNRSAVPATVTILSAE